MSNVELKYTGGIRSILDDLESLLPYWDYQITSITVNGRKYDLGPDVNTVGDFYNKFKEEYYERFNH